MLCTNCGQLLKNNNPLCKNCGHKLILPNSAVEDIKKGSEKIIHKNDVTAGQKSVDLDKQSSVIVNHELKLQDMLENEREEILERNQVLSLQQKRFKPLNVGMFFLMELCAVIPIVNIILLLVWSIRKNTNLNRKAFAKSILIWYAVLAVLVLAFVVALILMDVPLNLKYWLRRLSYT